MGIVIYRNQNEEKKDSWIKYFLGRIKQNKNNLIVVVGKTGSSKTWSSISICEKISKRNNVPFLIDNIVFNLEDLMRFINSEKAVKGASIIFDEPQISISSREWQSKANRVFNYLLTTFRHRNLNLFFCSPYEDLLDKSTRKLFHAKFKTVSINHKSKTAKLKPKILEYNSQKGKFYEKFLRICFKPKGKTKYRTVKLEYWEVPKPSLELIKQYETKKLRFTSKLNRDIEKELKEYNKKKKTRPDVREQAEQLLKRLGSVALVAAALGITRRGVNMRLAKGNPKKN